MTVTRFVSPTIIATVTIIIITCTSLAQPAPQPPTQQSANTSTNTSTKTTTNASADTATDKSSVTPIQQIHLAASQDSISVLFHPTDDCISAITNLINNAQHTILLHAHQLTNPFIIKSLLQAKKRRLRITLLLDNPNPNIRHHDRDAPTTNLFLKHHIPTFIAQHPTNSNTILIDNHTIIAGSLDFTITLNTSTTQNVIIIKNNSAIFTAYRNNFQQLLSHASRYTTASPVTSQPPNTPPQTTTPQTPLTDTPTDKQTQTPSPQAQITVYTTRYGRKYHTASCSHLRGKGIPISLKEAKKANLTPCSQCKPPQ